MIKIPKSHPRYKSLLTREKLIEGFRKGYVATAGLIAHGRGECFDYLLGEKSIESALIAEKVGTAYLLTAEHPVISVNGNTAALVPREIVQLAKETGSKIEVNLFYRTLKRAHKISNLLRNYGAEEVLGVEDATAVIPELESERRKVSPEGILKADVVLVPLEDGDRTEALRRLDKVVIAIDLNPLSRTARAANVTIVDNIVRAIPNMVRFAKELKKADKKLLKKLIEEFDNEALLKNAISYITRRLQSLVRQGITF